MTGAQPSEPSPASRLAELLEKRAGAITSEWHEQLNARLQLRPRNVFPGKKLLDGMPPMVEWITRSLRDRSSPGEANEEALRDVAEHWRAAGFSIEESLLHFRVLATLLFETLEGLVREEAAGVTPVEGVRAASRLCHSIDVAQVVLVATYRDAEEERITDFGTTLAHEVRDHLGASLGAIQLVQTLRDAEGPALDTDREAMLLERAEGALEKANDLVAAVRTVSHTAASSGEWTMQPLRRIVEEIVRDPDAQRDARVHLRIDEDIPPVLVPADPVSLILHNLVENAVKYSDPEKPEQWVRVQARREDDGHLVVQVGDNGLGISESEQERVFKRFQRGSRARGDGFGLGLAIARRAARSIGSRLMLESSPGDGSTFGFTVPVESQGEGPVTTEP